MSPDETYGPVVIIQGVVEGIIWLSTRLLMRGDPPRFSFLNLFLLGGAILAAVWVFGR